MTKKQKPFYYLEFGSHDLMFGSFSEKYTSRKEAVEALEKYVAKYASPWGQILKVTEVVATVKREVKLPKKRVKS